MNEVKKVVNIPINKKCPRCGKMLPSAFFSKKTKSKDGLQDYCKSCLSKMLKQSRKNKKKRLHNNELAVLSYNAKKNGLQYHFIEQKKKNGYRQNIIYKCLDCEKYYSDANAQNEITTSVVLPALGHNLNSVAKVDATCTADGCNAYYKCSRCNKLFKDNLATTETTLAAEKIAALGHAFGTSYVRENATYHAYKCSRCGVYDTSTHQAHTWSGLKQYSDLTKRYDYHYQDCTVSTCTATKVSQHNNNNGYVYENHGDKHLKSKKCSCGITYDGYEESHTYDQSVASSNYLKTAATCTSKAVYYKSCKCGAKGTATFTSGSVNSSNHNYVSGKCYAHANGGSAQVCSRCNRCKICGSTSTSH